MSQSDEDEHDSRSDTIVVQCEVCGSLNLDIDNFIVRPSRHPARRSKPSTFPLVSSTASIKLGTFEKISERHSGGCSFCGLVLASAKTSSLLGSNGDRTRSGAICYMRWEIDGRRAGATTHAGGYDVGPRAPGGITRRIRLHWDDAHLEDAYLVAVAQQRYLTTLSDAHLAWSSDSLFLGRRIEHDGLNQARLNSWTDLCKLHHPHPCNDWFSTETPPKFWDMLTHSYFGVIDVINMQLVQLPTYPSRQGARPASYAALSYVWGEDKTTFKTLKNNVNALRMHGGLERFIPELPPVIRDAIDLTRRLNLKFIWIDALCIIQDSQDSWRLNAYNMDVIYGNAEVTICAADGDGADTGLKAARPSATRSPQIAECGEDLYLMLVRTPESYIKASTWNTRAWTFQERLMSRRCLVFVDGRVFFQCPSTGMSEDIYADRDGSGWSLDLVDAPMRMFRQMSERSFWVYMNVAELYSSRKLTKKKDILAAFWGITLRMKRIMQAPFVFGLPSSHFDLAILWQHTGPAARREPTSAEEMLEYAEHRFPTWSWTGWTGPSISYSHDMLGDCLDNTNEWLTSHTWIRWYIRDGTGDLRPLWDPPTWRTDHSKDVKWQGYGCTMIPN
ncbi:heterokaryon incompatibility protein-domain-containing protein [Massariosphaeria phaeospora]|uniref:Heterokaryon incompatibility protein-domain-containing protein n=1 Tax=Massariosphaeria phaeospora TaxID=100035 RepID=A0A7C8MF24_9PLEO|nr:heterokaryon incompatibility protein-domain-containing protein [Massariosphaeria phaeospora]